MLGEGFLHVLNYAGAHTHLGEPPPRAASPKYDRDPHRAPQANQMGGARDARPRPAPAPSVALAIPAGHSFADPYESGLFPSLYRAYPDLVLAGGTLPPRHSLAPHADGPLLISQDLGSMEALKEPEGGRGGGGGGARGPGPADQGYLVMEGAGPRLTDSMLNGFLETQLMEVYRQHMQDSLALRSPSSITSAGGPWARGPSPGDGEAPGGLRYLSTCSATCTTNFSSPVLRISQDPGRDS